MSQHTYTLKFTIKDTYEDLGEGIVHNPKEDLTQVMKTEDEVDYTKEDLIRIAAEERIKEIIPALSGAIQVVFDSLVKD